MDAVQACFLSGLRCALRGTPLDYTPGLSPEQWQQVFRLSNQHHVLPLVFEAVHSLPELSGAPLLPDIRRQVRQLVFLQTRKTAEFLRLMQSLEEENVRPLVVKGIVCRSLYPHPDHRFSSDEDLLIAPEELAACQEVFARFGMTTELSGLRLQEEYEIPYRSADGILYIELHRSLFPPQSDSYGHLNRFFRDAGRRAVPLQVGSGKVYTLEPTDHLFYLICHALKHFLHSGFGLRQVCDILLFAQSFGQQIQWSRLEENLRRIHGLTFTAALVRIGRDWLGLSVGCWPPAVSEAPVDAAPMLEDLLGAGIYGSASDSRRHSSSITLEAVASRKQQRNVRSSLAVSLFPPARSLKNRYPYLNDRPWLLPAAWASRLGTYCRESLLHRPTEAAEALKLGSKRVALLEYYGILE